MWVDVKNLYTLSQQIMHENSTHPPDFRVSRWNLQKLTQQRVGFEPVTLASSYLGVTTRLRLEGRV